MTRYKTTWSGQHIRIMGRVVIGPPYTEPTALVPDVKPDELERFRNIVRWRHVGVLSLHMHADQGR